MVKICVCFCKSYTFVKMKVSATDQLSEKCRPAGKDLWISLKEVLSIFALSGAGT